jgi:hypothetical protein
MSLLKITCQYVLLLRSEVRENWLWIWDLDIKTLFKMSTTLLYPTGHIVSPKYILKTCRSSLFRRRNIDDLENLQMTEDARNGAIIIEHGRPVIKTR